jgi:hypothetical protein
MHTPSWVRAIAFHPLHPHQLCVSTDDGDLQLWDTRDGGYSPFYTLAVSVEPVLNVCWVSAAPHVLWFTVRSSVRVLTVSCGLENEQNRKTGGKPFSICLHIPILFIDQSIYLSILLLTLFCFVRCALCVV